jgi:DNA repair exonuclease SbcCD ATPase subunit
VFVEFLELKYRNFISFGNQLTSINFQSGLNLITGKNGGGKSGGLLDPLAFCLFGRPFRKMTINELVNRTNKKKLYTEVTFKISEDTFTIIRTLLPNSLKILKNENEYKLQSSKRLIQDEINRIIGIDYEMFKQIIVLAINAEKPFLEMDFGTKRQIIESITNVKILGEMLKFCKLDLTNLKTQVDLNKNSLAIFEDNLYSTNKRLEELTSARNSFEKNNADDLLKTNTKLSKLKTDLIDKQTSLEIIRNKTKDVSGVDKVIKDLTRKVQILTKEISVENYKIFQAQEHIEFMKTNDICPKCNTKITEEHKQQELSQLTKDIELFTNNVNSSNEKLKEINLSIKNNKDLLDTQKDLEYQIKTEQQNVTWTLAEIKNQEERIGEISKRVFDIDLVSLKLELERKTKEYFVLNDRNSAQLKQLQNNEVVSNVLSDNGIKAYFFKKIMPILNNKINDYLKKFDMTIKIEINEFLEDKIYGLDLTGKEVSYFSHSEGEKKRIDISILLAFIDISKLISNWDCSLLIFDEILDGKLDDDGLDIVVQALRKFIIENRKLSAYIISHKLHEYDVFDRHFKVSKAAGFSRIEQIY